MGAEEIASIRNAHAKTIESCARRLLQLCEDGGPEVLIEASRQLLARTLIFFPVNPEYQSGIEAMEIGEKEKVNEYLARTGYEPSMGERND